MDSTRNSKCLSVHLHVIDVQKAHHSTRCWFSFDFLHLNSFHFSIGHIDAKPILHHIQRDHKHHHCDDGDDRHIGKCPGDHLSNLCVRRRDLAMSTGEARAKTLATVVAQQWSTNTLILTADIQTVVDSCLTVIVSPARGARAQEGLVRCTARSYTINKTTYPPDLALTVRCTYRCSSRCSTCRVDSRARSECH